MNIVSSLILLIIGVPVTYVYLLALAAVRTRSTQPSQRPRHRFAIAIPAHDEETVIGRTVTTLRQLDYPPHLFDIHVVADHCTDHTAQVAHAAGAIVHERREGSRGKGPALRWLFNRIFDEPSRITHHASRITDYAIRNTQYDALVIFDADTQVDSRFLRVMDACLARGDDVIQGQHRISNPHDGWFPALIWAMFMVDNRFGNLGRSNLGWSAKNMGDSICFRADLLRRLGWGEGLTEDYQFRFRLLLEGVRIRYEPAAVGYGEAPASLAAARTQRARWLKGTYQTARQHAWTLLRQGLRRGDLALVDGAAQALLPSYSTLTVITLAVLVLQLGLNAGLGPLFSPLLLTLGALTLILLAIYPLLGLALERAPRRAYLAILAGPVFILWRTWLSLVARFGRQPVVWVRTARRGRP